MKYKSANTSILSVSVPAWLLVALFSTGCASTGRSIRDFITGNEPGEATAAKAGGSTKFSDNENVKVTGDRDYKRMTRQKFEEDSELNEGAGSLWVMEGQGAYLFSQNQMRTIGDLLNVKIEGSPKAQLQTKVRVISKLLERLEAPTARGLASQAPPVGAAPGAPPAATDAAAGADGKTPKENGAKTPAAGETAAAGTEPPKGEVPFSVQVVPTRIVEQLKDGSYRVRGMQPFMIGKREYKVIVTGVVRPEDFDDAGIDSTRLLDSQFDIVSSKRGAAM